MSRRLLQKLIDSNRVFPNRDDRRTLKLSLDRHGIEPLFDSGNETDLAQAVSKPIVN